MAIKFTKTSKLGCMSWDLQARETCPGSLDSNGGLVDSCAGCYASYGTFLYPNTKAVRVLNREDWKREEWVDEMVAGLRGQTHFRWFSSGDCYHIKLARKIYQVMAATPDTKHWFPTRVFKFTKFQPILAAMDSLPNVKVRFSSDSVLGDYTVGLHGSTIVPTGKVVPEGVTICNAPDNAGKCGGCRACWSKDVPVIGYRSHGMRIRTIIKMAEKKAA